MPAPAPPSPSPKPATGWTLAAWGLAPLLLLAALAAWAAWPVCVPLPAEALAQFDPPITQRDDQFWHVRTFQQHGGQWHQCKPRIARAFFF